MPAKRTLSLTSLIVMPLKQHLGCCVIVPLLIKIVGSVGILSSLMTVSTRYDLYLALGLAPFIVWGCLVLEDKFHNWQHRRGHFAHGHAHNHNHDTCHSCDPCPVDHSHTAFHRRFWINLIIAIIVILAIESLHHHTS